MADGRTGRAQVTQRHSGGEVALDYQVLAYTMAFDEGPAVISGSIQECRPEHQCCGPGTNSPLLLVQIGDQPADPAPGAVRGGAVTAAAGVRELCPKVQ